MPAELDEATPLNQIRYSEEPYFFMGGREMAALFF